MLKLLNWFGLYTRGQVWHYTSVARSEGAIETMKHFERDERDTVYIDAAHRPLVSRQEVDDELSRLKHL